VNIEDAERLLDKTNKQVFGKHTNEGNATEAVWDFDNVPQHSEYLPVNYDSKGTFHAVALISQRSNFLMKV
jgi:hypothetical protein